MAFYLFHETIHLFIKMFAFLKRIFPHLISFVCWFSFFARKNTINSRQKCKYWHCKIMVKFRWWTETNNNNNKEKRKNGTKNGRTYLKDNTTLDLNYVEPNSSLERKWEEYSQKYLAECKFTLNNTIQESNKKQSETAGRNGDKVSWRTYIHPDITFGETLASRKNNRHTQYDCSKLTLRDIGLSVFVVNAYNSHIIHCCSCFINIGIFTWLEFRSTSVLRFCPHRP